MLWSLITIFNKPSRLYLFVFVYCIRIVKYLPDTLGVEEKYSALKRGGVGALADLLSNISENLGYILLHLIHSLQKSRRINQWSYNCVTNLFLSPWIRFLAPLVETKHKWYYSVGTARSVTLTR